MASSARCVDKKHGGRSLGAGDGRSRPARLRAIASTDANADRRSAISSSDSGGHRVAIAVTAADSEPVAQPKPVAGRAAIAYERDGNIWSAAADGGHARQLTAVGDAHTPRWSADGRWLVFVRGRDRGSELYIIAGDGGSPRRLTSNARPESGPAWSPDSRQIAYTLPASLGPGGQPDPRAAEEIWIVDVSTAATRKLGDGFDPAWSPDGRLVAYATNGRRRAAGPPGPTQNAIHLVNADGQSDRQAVAVSQLPLDLDPSYRLPFRPATFRLRAPAWSPDGQTLAASADGHTGMAITVDRQGHGLQVWALAYEGGVGRVVWSPHGDRLAVESHPATGVETVQIVDLASRAETRIGGAQEELAASDPSWSPDGRRLVVTTRDEPPGDHRGRERSLRIFTTEGVESGAIATGAVSKPDWNPARP